MQTKRAAKKMSVNLDVIDIKTLQKGKPKV